MTASRSIKDMQAAMSPAMEALRAENAELKSLLSIAKRESGETSEIVAEIRAAARRIAPISLKPIKQGKIVSSPVSMVAHLTDLHVGLVTPKDDIEGFCDFNWELAQSRMSSFAQRLSDWVAIHRNGYNVDECVILGTGDWISGDIHDGLVRTNEFPAPVQAVKAGYLVAAFTREMAKVFPKVRLEFVTMGNHDRLTRKPQAQAGGYNSWGFVVGHIAAESVKSLGNVVVNIYPRSQQVIDVSGTRYLCGHGAGILGTWGIPYYGIERRKQREAMARMNMPEDRHFDKIVIGHFHHGLNHEHWLIGGSLSGTDENDHGQGRHSAPHQTAWFVHPKHGEFDWTRFWL